MGKTWPNTSKETMDLLRYYRVKMRIYVWSEVGKIAKWCWPSHKYCSGTAVVFLLPFSFWGFHTASVCIELRFKIWPDPDFLVYVSRYRINQYGSISGFLNGENSKYVDKIKMVASYGVLRIRKCSDWNFMLDTKVASGSRSGLLEGKRSKINLCMSKLVNFVT